MHRLPGGDAVLQNKSKTVWTYVISIAAALAVGGASAIVNAGRMENQSIIRPPLSPPSWLFPIVWSLLFLLMGISAARVWRSGAPERSDALFLYCTQLVVNFLWTVFFFRFEAFLLSFFWLVFLILLVVLMLVRFEKCAVGAGKLQIPYVVWLLFAAYLNFAVWLLNC